MVWYVVHFKSDDTVEVVPESWYITTSEECFWPPAKTPRHKIREAQKEKHQPGTDWKPYSALVMGKYDSFALADSKASKAKYTDMLSSMEECGKGKRFKKRNAKYSKHRVEFSSSEARTSSDDSTAYPLEPKRQKKSKLPASQQESNGFSIPRNDVVANTVTSGHLSEATNAGSEVFVYKPVAPEGIRSRMSTPTLPSTPSMVDTRSDEDFKRTVLKQLYIIVMKLNDLSDLVIKKMNESPSTTEETGQNKEILNNILNQFPLDYDSLLNLENTVANNKDFRRLLVNHFRGIGGLTVKDITRRLMYQTFSNELGSQFSWEGAKGKKPFKKLAIARVIIEAVRLNIPTKDATEHDVVSNIKAWLVRCPDRIKKENKRIIEEDN